MQGIKDPQVLEILLEEKRLVVTCDTDFLKYRDGISFGAVLIKGDYKVTSELAERVVWTIEYIIQNPDGLNDLTVLERATPYGSWKMYTQGNKTMITWLSYSVERLTISSHGEMISVPVSHLDSEGKSDSELLNTLLVLLTVMQIGHR